MTRGTLRRLLVEHRVAAGPLGLALAGVLGLVAARFRLTFLAKSWADGPLRTGDLAGLAPLLLTAALVTAGGAAALLTSRLALSAAVQRVEDRLRRRVEESLLRAPLASLAARGGPGAALSVVVHDTAAAGAFTTALVKRVAGDGAVSAAGVACMLALDPLLTLAALTAVPLGALVLSLSARRLRALGMRQQQALARLAAFLAERAHGLSTIKGFGTERDEAAAYGRVNQAYRRSLVSAELLTGGLLAGVWLATGAGVVAVVWAGTLRVAAGALTPGALLAFALAAGQAIEPLRRLGEAMAALQASLAAAERVHEVIDLPREDLGDPGDLPSEAGLSVALEGVGFAYREGAPVLDGLSFSVGPGEAVGVVAESGGGKSTLAAILGGLLTPGSGRLLLGGVDVAAMSLARRRRLVSVAPQEPFVFAGPLGANVAYGASGAPEGELEAAARAAGLERRDGPRALLGEAGRDLSGGERQRVALARAGLRRSPVVVLDEATSALDAEAEAELLSRLAPALSGRTLIVFSHRLSTVARLPRVVVLEAGRVTADGSPAGLAAEEGPFRRLFGAQLPPAGVPPPAPRARGQQG